MQPHHQFAFPDVINRIGLFDWSALTERELIDVAWAYYFFSVQFRENLTVARSLFPHDPKLRQLEAEECDTDNLSPWPGVAAPGERVNHDEFMKRLLELSPIDADKRADFEMRGNQYLRMVRHLHPMARALSIASYEDGGLECVFRAILQAPDTANPLIQAFRHFLSEHIRFDSDPEQGHGALSRHMVPDDSILPLWNGFAELLLDFVPSLEKRELADADAAMSLSM